MIISASVKPEVIESKNMVIGLAEQIELAIGSFGKWIFLIGFWGAVFSSMIGVWHGIPYLFADFYHEHKKIKISSDESLSKSKPYKVYLLYIVFLE